MKLAFLLSSLLVAMASKYSFAQQSLPPCTSDTWRHNCRGDITYSNSDRYSGGFLNNKRHFFGTYLFLGDEETRGSRYEGEYKENEYHGFGTFTHKSGWKYIGEFVGNKFNGRGTYYHSNGAYFEGQYKDNKRHGFGAHTLSDKSRRVGDWIDDKAAGEGIYYMADGRISQSGRWEDNKLVASYSLDSEKFSFTRNIHQSQPSQITTGWGLFIGKNGSVNELEALRLTAEAIKSAESANNERATSVYRNNLGVIHMCALDPRVRDYELGRKIMKREFGKNNISSDNYIWGVFLRVEETNEKEFISVLKEQRPTHLISKYIQANNNRLPKGLADALKILEAGAYKGDYEAAKWIAYQYECSRKPLDLKEAERWFSRALALQRENPNVGEREIRSLEERLTRIQILKRLQTQ